MLDEARSTLIALLQQDINLEHSYTIAKDGFKEAIGMSESNPDAHFIYSYQPSTEYLFNFVVFPKYR